MLLCGMGTNKIRPTLVHTIICDDVRQELGGKFSLMGLFETISSRAFPIVHPRFAIMNEWTGGRGEFSCRVRLLAPDRTTALWESESRFALYNETQRHRDISVRFNTTFPLPGTYWIEIILDGTQLALVPLTVQHLSQEIVH